MIVFNKNNILNNDQINYSFVGQVFGKNLSNHLKSRLYPSYLSTLPKVQFEDVQSYEGMLLFSLIKLSH